MLIGRRGQTLESLQYITSLAVNRQGGDWIRINLDIGDYRAKREETLRSLAQRAAMKVESTGRRVALDAMNAAERRIVHQELQEFGGVITQSEGQEPYRRGHTSGLEVRSVGCQNERIGVHCARPFFLLW